MAKSEQPNKGNSRRSPKGILDAKLILLGARSAAFSVTMLVARSVVRSAAFQDDMIQEIALRVIEADRRGYKSGRRAYRMYARDALRHLLGDSRCRSRYYLECAAGETLPEIPVTSRPELGPLCLWRLQQIYPTLTATQKAGVFSIITDGYGAAAREVAQVFGVDVSNLAAARKRALERINNPGAFTRVASRNLKTLEERRRYNRERQKRLRMKQKDLVKTTG